VGGAGNGYTGFTFKCKTHSLTNPITYFNGKLKIQKCNTPVGKPALLLMDRSPGHKTTPGAKLLVRPGSGALPAAPGKYCVLGVL